MKKPTAAMIEKRLKGLMNYRVALTYFARKDHGALLVDAKKFSGIQTLGKVTVASSTHFNLEATVSEGDLKIYAVNKEGLIKIWEVGMSVTSFSLPYGKYRLRLVGDSASFSLKVAIAPSV